MPTHRSLNKLEFKAHMSIHNLVDVPEDETHGSNSTRDRFGKKHHLSNEDGSPRLPAGRAGVDARRVNRKLTVLAVAALLGPFVGVFARAEESSLPPARPVGHSNTDIRVETKGLDANSWLNQKKPAEEKFGIPIDESAAVEINENGDPNLNMRF